MILVVGIVIHLIAGVFAYGLTLGNFTKEFPWSSHLSISLFLGIAGVIGLVAAIVCSAVDGGLRLRFRPMTKEESWEAHLAKWPSLPREYFELTY